MPIKAITFDFWQTLYQSKTIDYTARIRFLKEEIESGCGVTLEQIRFETAVKVARDTWNRTWVEEHRTITADEWLGIVVRYLEVSVEAPHLLKMQSWMEDSVLADRPTLVPEAGEALAELSSRYRLAIISDTGLTPGRTLRRLLEEDDLVRYFTHLTFSDEVGRSKPHPDNFLATLKALEVQAAEAVHVGDMLRTDIAGAQGVGMRGVQYIGLSQDPTSTQVRPDAVIRNHKELAGLLEGWGASQQIVL